ncbi:MAG: TVP38/TMEM64 family protein [Alphaproteobacteria bacterium]|nr:TVP38/TMEM64 family protein [Alphaproteobacteria bacterium]
MAMGLRENRTSKEVPTNWFRVLLLPGLIALALAAVFGLHIERYLSFEALAENRAWLLAQVARNAIIAALSFGFVYVLATTLSLPGSSILTMGAGFLFGLYWGSVIAVTAATVGATLLFLVARTSLGEFTRRRTQSALSKLQEGFAKDALSYLLFLRLVPAFPFWLINLAAAFLDVRLRTFVLGTFLGIIPGAVVYASVGNGLGAILDHGQKPDLGIILTPPILIPMLALAGLSLIPIAYRRWRRS